MPHASDDDLPPGVRRHLPEHARHVWGTAFDSAWASHAGEARQEEIAFRIAWAAVERSSARIDGEGVPIGPARPPR